jgi:4-hydroxybenzoate polyprenyltransferase
LPILWGGPLAGCLLVTAFLAAALTLPVSFVGGLFLYFAGTCVYSFYAKRVVMLDVMTLAGLYTIRVVAGGLATDLVVSEWLLAFSMFFFVSLAFAKRYSELRRLLHTSTEAAVGRGYLVSDIGLIESAGPASGYIAVLVLALYVDGEQMRLLYQTSWPLWLICPLLMYWIGRIWIYAKRGALSEEPIVFAVRDRVSLLVGAMVIALLIAGSSL